jgi:hypothetical protein
LRPVWAKVVARPLLKNKRAADIVQMVECLPSTYKVLSSIPSTGKKKKKEAPN